MKFTNDSFVVLWNPNQNSFGLETVGEMLKQNGELFAKMLEADPASPDSLGGEFLALCFADTYEAANEQRRIWTQMRDEKMDAQGN